jgi:hypothetical protein
VVQRILKRFWYHLGLHKFFLKIVILILTLNNGTYVAAFLTSSFDHFIMKLLELRLSSVLSHVSSLLCLSNNEIKLNRKINNDLEERWWIQLLIFVLDKRQQRKNMRGSRFKLLYRVQHFVSKKMLKQNIILQHNLI